MERFAAGRVPILILHRFASCVGSRDLQLYQRHSIAALRKNLEYLRRRKFNVLALDALLKQMAQGVPPSPRSVVFTVDDGYADFHDFALPVFVEFDCPVTIFLTTGPADEECWLWWDKLEFAIRRTDCTALDVAIEGTTWRVEWRNRREREAAFEAIAERLKRSPADVRDRVIGDAAEVLDVDLPSLAPPDYAPMTWDQVRACERTGLVQFGPHTVTHPILSMVPDTRAVDELTVSWRRVQEECAAPVPIFAYPNGTPDAYGLREVEIVRRLKLTAAVTTEARYLSHPDFDDPKFPLARFAIPRVPYADEHDEFRQAVHGVEHAKWRIRGQRSEGHAAAWRVSHSG